MINLFARKFAVGGTQKLIEKLNPKINVHVPSDLPLPSIHKLKEVCPVVAKIGGYEEELGRLDDSQLQAKTQEFRAKYDEAVKLAKKSVSELRQQYRSTTNYDEKEAINIKLEAAKEELKKKKKKILDEILPEAFAVVRETGKRVLKMRHYDVQMIGGMVLHNGNIAEMTTGEGKTLMATLPAYLNGLTGEGVHVVTVNDYLAERDCQWMAPIFQFLGLSVGNIQHDMVPSERQKAYACDITYGTNNEFGFDYLRDNMVNYREDMVQRPHNFAIVDEVDSILIDEARTPLIISGPAEKSTDKYYRANEIIKNLKGRRITEKDEVDAKYQGEDLSKGFDYMADEKNKSISLTEQGEEAAAKAFGIDNLHDMETIEYRHHILQALRAHEFFKIDVDYVLRDGQVIIVDEFTGRLMPGRRWSDGLHQAVEAREGIKIERENQTLATITFQNYFRMYEKLSGMTGTADTEATEFKQIYDLDVVVIPTNKILQRKNYGDSIYKTVREKFDAVVEDIAECHKNGQPVLVGTISIEKSELLGNLLKQKGVPHQVLNAKFHEQEANIIAQAGRFKGVTIATNMAGRGTDIVLGGNAEFLAKSLAEQKSSDSKENVEDMTEKFIVQFQEQTKEDQKKVIDAGGLHVIGTERHESRRIDNQLRGRQGRQGDPGSSKFFVSLEDDLMRLFASDRIMGLMEKLGMEEGQVLEHPWLSKALENAQRRVESHNFEIRKHLLEYDDVMNKQREVIYRLRLAILESDNIKHLYEEALGDALYGAIVDYLFSGTEEESKWDIDGLDVYLKTNFELDLTPHKDKMKDMSQDDIFDLLNKQLLELYAAKESQVGADHLRHLERMLYMHTIDSKWKDHLYAMDQLKEGIGLRSYAQRNPLIEYKKEGFQMFQEMYSSINQEVAEVIFKIQPVETQKKIQGVFDSVPQNLVHEKSSGLSSPAEASAPPSLPSQSQPKAVPIRKEQGTKVGRNDPCPCGSGEKYKKCCGK